MFRQTGFIGLLLLGLLMGQACQPLDDKQPDNLIPQDRMTNILTDIHLAEARVSRMGLSSSDSSNIVYKRLEKDIFKKYQIDTAAYNNSYIYYSSRPDKMEVIYKEIVANLQKRMETKPKTRP